MINNGCGWMTNSKRTAKFSSSVKELVTRTSGAAVFWLCSNTFYLYLVLPGLQTRALIFKHQRLAEYLICFIALTRTQMDHVAAKNVISIQTCKGNTTYTQTQACGILQTSLTKDDTSSTLCLLLRCLVKVDRGK